MEISNCYHCGNSEHSFYAEENGFTLVQCDKCGLLFVKNPPDEEKISESAKQGKHEGEKELDVTGQFKSWKILRYLRILDDLYPEGIDIEKSWLDVGCGHGEFMKAVQRFSEGRVNIQGSEPNVFKQESARKRGLDVGYFELESHKKKYDIVSLLDVYSHIPDPPGFLNLLKNLVNKNGEIIIETGNTTHLNAKDFMRPFNLPDHLSFASKDIVVNILESIGFQVIRIKEYPPLERNIQSLCREFAKIFLPKYNSRIRYIYSGKYSNTDMFIRARPVDKLPTPVMQKGDIRTESQ